MGGAYPVELTHEQQQQYASAYSIPTNGPADSTHPSTNEFRARFHRSLVAPTPFRTFTDGQAATAAASTPTSASGSTSDPIDPHLAAAGGVGNQTNGNTIAGGSGVGKSESPTLNDAYGSVDPDFG